MRGAAPLVAVAILVIAAVLICSMCRYTLVSGDGHAYRMDRLTGEVCPIDPGEPKDYCWPIRKPKPP